MNERLMVTYRIAVDVVRPYHERQDDAKEPSDMGEVDFGSWSAAP